jgi:glycine cleavage system aminomethyltransferase T
VPNWVEYHVETGEYDAWTEADERYHDKPADVPHKTFRYQLQGPNAVAVLDAATDGPTPDIPFFEFEEVTIDGRTVKALGHSMSAHPGYEIWGPWEDSEAIRESLVDAGQAYGIRQLGEKSFKAQQAEKGWVARPVPAIFGDEMEAYRRWLDDDSYEAISTLGGSFHADDISDYYVTPAEVGYGSFVDFDHEFVGRDALRAEVGDPDRTTVTLVWDDDDVLGTFESLFREGETQKYFDLSKPFWSVFHYDEVLKDGDHVGVSKYFTYTYNERTVLSVGVVDTDHAEPGTRVTLVWGEPGGTSPNPKVEPHVQAEIGATVAPAPYVDQRYVEA